MKCLFSRALSLPHLLAPYRHVEGHSWPHWSITAVYEAVNMIVVGGIDTEIGCVSLASETTQPNHTHRSRGLRDM